MKFEQYTRFASEQWRVAMSESEHFSLEKCTDGEKIDIWDKISVSYDLGIGTDVRRVDMALERLEKLGAFSKGTIALDVGCGTGAYTLGLAERCSSVYALDNSKGMQKVLKEKAKKHGLNNIIPVCADWRAISELDLPNTFDVVLSSLNTGINNFDSLIKMNTFSHGFCCYAAPHGKTINKTRSEFQKIVFGRELQAAGGNDIIHAFNIIYGLGYHPELTYAPSEWIRSQTPEDALDAVCRDFGRYGVLSETVKSKIYEYIMTHLDNNGMFVQYQKSMIGIMIWDVREIAE